MAWKLEMLNGHHFHTLQSAQSFLESSMDFLKQREDYYATIISTAEMITRSSAIYREPFWFGIISDEKESVTGCAIHADPDGLTIAGAPPLFAHRICEWIAEANITPRRITSEPDVADAISNYWREYGDRSVALQHDWAIYRLDSLSDHYSSASGQLRPARKDETELVLEWGNLYGREKPAFLNVGDFFVRKLHSHELYVWDDNGPTAIITVSSKTENGIRISGLYTPQEFRGHGYATSLVTEICASNLSSGLSFITLSAQKGDPVENLYERLGFYTIGHRKSITYRP